MHGHISSLATILYKNAHRWVSARLLAHQPDQLAIALNVLDTKAVVEHMRGVVDREAVKPEPTLHREIRVQLILFVDKPGIQVEFDELG